MLIHNIRLGIAILEAVVAGWKNYVSQAVEFVTYALGGRGRGGGGRTAPDFPGSNERSEPGQGLEAWDGSPLELPSCLKRFRQ